MSPLFLGGHTAIDFLNTALEPDGVAVEFIGDGKALLDWMKLAEILDLEQAARLTRKLGVKGLDAAATDVRKFREWARHWLTRWRAAPNRDYSVEIAALNELLEKRIVRHSVVRVRQGLSLVAQSDLETAEDLLAAFAAHIAELITREDPTLLKSCAGNGCTVWFMDRTRAHRRLFCSATACGNRAKVAAFRERQRE